MCPSDPYTGDCPFSSLDANGVTVTPQGSPDDSSASWSLGNRDTVARTAMVAWDFLFFFFFSFLGEQTGMVGGEAGGVGYVGER